MKVMVTFRIRGQESETSRKPLRRGNLEVPSMEEAAVKAVLAADIRASGPIAEEDLIVEKVEAMPSPT